MFAIRDADSDERLLADPYGRGLDVRMVLEEVAAERCRELFDRFQRVLLRQCVGDVFHRVGRDDQAVVADRIGIGEVTFELDSDRELAHLVTLSLTRHLGESNSRFAVRMMGQHDSHDLDPRDCRLVHAVR